MEDYVAQLMQLVNTINITEYHQSEQQLMADLFLTNSSYITVKKQKTSVEGLIDQLDWMHMVKNGVNWQSFEEAMDYKMDICSWSGYVVPFEPKKFSI